MASRVSSRDMREEAAAACWLEAFHWMTLMMLMIEVTVPTTPAMREKMMKNPVAMFPIGKYIGNI